jgi:hypothetical protein
MADEGAFVVCDGVTVRDAALLVVFLVSLEFDGAGCVQSASAETATSVIERASSRIGCVARILFLAILFRKTKTVV